MSRIAITIALAALFLPVAAAPEDSPQTPQIHVATRLVEVGIIVRNKNGPVENLTKDNFTILDQDKPQQISIFTVNSAINSQPPAQLLPQNTFSDLPQYSAAAKPRSITIVLLDNLNTLYGSAPESIYENTPYWVEDLALQNAKNHLIEFIQQLQPEDRIAIYGLRDSLHVLCDFTCDRGQLLGILEHYDTTPMTNRAVVEPGLEHAPLKAANGFENGAAALGAGIANEDRAVETMAALQQIAAHVANIPGRKNLVWLTSDLPFSGAAMARLLSPANIAAYPVDARGLLAQSVTMALVPGVDLNEVNGAPAAPPFVPIPGHVDNEPGQSFRPIGIDAMKELAGETGGQAFVNTNDITGAIRKAVEDSAVTYTLGFYIDRDALDGKFHEVKVEVRGKGLTIRYPKGYYAFPDTAPAKNEDQTRLLSAEQSPLQSSVIPLQATLSRVDQPEPHSLSLSCSIDVHNLQLVQTGNLRKGAVIVYVLEQDQTGKVVYQWDQGYSIQANDAQVAALLKSGVVFQKDLHPEADVTTLRILVEDPATSEVGSLIIPLYEVH
jgi:VWFA-related protein